jgi:hypothetical protein
MNWLWDWSPGPGFIVNLSRPYLYAIRKSLARKNSYRCERKLLARADAGRMAGGQSFQSVREADIASHCSDSYRIV